MCEHFLSAMTVESFLRLTGSETLEDLVGLLLDYWIILFRYIISPDALK